MRVNQFTLTFDSGLSGPTLEPPVRHYEMA
jgi:hypothetical protein